MEFRRIPFQFSSTDPAKRQAELQKRFGLPSKQDKMHIDLMNPGFMGSKESNSASSSPRLQHRVPIFVEGMADKSSSDANPTNVDAGQKPRVRIVPIEIENPDGSTRHRTLSGSSCADGKPFQQGSWISDDMKPKRSWFPDDIGPKEEATSIKSPRGPKVCTIPVKIEGGDKVKKAKAPTPEKKKPTAKVIPVQKQNGCNVTKVSKSEEKKVPLSPVFQASLKKIDIVLEKLKGYQSDVEKFTGTVKEKQYRYLDEMLTRLMLDLDNVETMGNEEVRLARKAAIKKVQHCIDLLESKVNENSQNQAGTKGEGPEVASEAKKESEIVEADPVESADSVINTSGSTLGVPEVEMEDPLKKESEIVKTDSVEEIVNSVDKSTDSTPLVPEVEMEEPLTNAEEMGTVRVTESQQMQLMETDDSHVESVPCDEPQLQQPMETEGAENVKLIASEEPVSELGKDNVIKVGDNSSEPSTAAELPSDLVSQTECSMKEVNPSDGGISDVKSNSELESETCQHSNVSSDKAVTANGETVENSEMTDSTVTVKDLPNLSIES